mgnify:CR=1 FL=1
MRCDTSTASSSLAATRGAIDWHFKDKADLFNAMMERVKLPLEAAAHASGTATDKAVKNMNPIIQQEAEKAAKKVM